MKIICTDQDGNTKELEALEGWRVMEIIRDWDMPIKAECGGACSCATCHVYVAPEWLNKLIPAKDEELDMLDTVPDIQDNSRLSCQIIMREELDGLKVTLALSSRKD
jgi:2Fe-2S ferredoxin